MQNHKYDEGVVDIRGATGGAVTISGGFPHVIGSDLVNNIELVHFKLGVDRGIEFSQA